MLFSLVVPIIFCFVELTLFLKAYALKYLEAVLVQHILLWISLLVVIYNISKVLDVANVQTVHLSRNDFRERKQSKCLVSKRKILVCICCILLDVSTLKKWYLFPVGRVVNKASFYDILSLNISSIYILVNGQHVCTK